MAKLMKNGKVESVENEMNEIINETAVAETSATETAVEEVVTPSADSTDKAVQEMMDKDAERKAKKKERKDKLNASKSVLRSYLADATIPDALKDAIKIIVGSGERASSGGNTTQSLSSKLRDLFVEKQTVSEMDLFVAFKIGRSEMRKKAREILKDFTGDERVWIQFDEASESWQVLGTGVEMPQGWEGYVPSN